MCHWFSCSTATTKRTGRSRHSPSSDSTLASRATWPAAWTPGREPGASWRQSNRFDVRALHARLARGSGPRVIDVREQAEWNAGHIQGASRLSYKLLEAHLGELALAPGTEVALVCHSGARSSMAASMLKRHGLRRVANIAGGMQAWAAADLPVADGAGCALPGA